MPTNAHCLTCGAALPVVAGSRGGRRARFCSGACRQRAYRRRVGSRRAGCVGRATETALLRRLLTHHRLVTITGPGGIGKTRLARELAGARFVDVSTVDLNLDGVPLAAEGHEHPPGGDQARTDLGGGHEDLRRGTTVTPAARNARRPADPATDEHSRDADPNRAQAIPDAPRAASTLPCRRNVGSAADQHTADSAQAPTDRRTAPFRADPGDLLVLDGCDVRPGASAVLVESLLRQYPGLRIVATSRVVLGVQGEQVLPLRGLSPADSARLLVDRIHLLDPLFAVTTADVGEVCRRLEGVPAALERAARRVRLLGPAGALEGLATALDLAPTVREGLERDRRGLGEAERAAWLRLSILPGPFDAELAAVLGVGPETLERLVAASLLVSEPAADGTTGLRLWAAARAYGQERLDAAGGADAAFERLAAYLVAQVEPHLAAFLLPDGLCRRLVARAEPVLTTIDRLAARGDARLAVLACGLARAWLALGRNVAESEHLLREALPHTRDRPDLTASLLAALCKAAHRTGRYAEQLRLGRRALAIESTLDRPPRVASILDLLAAGLRASGDNPDGHYREALKIARELADPAVLSLLLNDLAWAALETGDLTTARAVLAEGLPLARAHATPGRLASVLHTAGALALAAEDHASAEACFVEALLVTNPTDGLKVPYFTEGVAIVLTTRGGHERALGLFACADAVRRGLGAVAEPAWRRRVHTATARATASLDPRRAHAATRAGARVTLASAVAHALDASEHTGRGRLTAQEHTVAALVTDGLTNQQIARRLGIAPRTVATHLERIRTKLGVRPRSALAAWFTRTTADQ
ncbi:ATP-binding protein [Amycolatopsis sp. NPDC004368]